MALNRNHSQEGGVVIPNAERYRWAAAGPWGPVGWGPGWGGSSSPPALAAGPAGPGGGRQLGPAGAAHRPLPAPARPGGCVIKAFPGSVGAGWGRRWGAGLAGADRAAPSSLLKLLGP